MNDRNSFLPSGARLVDCGDRQTGMTWPLPVDAVVDNLLDALIEYGGRSSRKEIVAALVANAAGTRPEDLDALLRWYRTAVVRDVLPVENDEANVVPFTHRGPGPRSARR